MAAAIKQLDTPLNRADQIRRARAELNELSADIIEDTKGNIIEAKATLLVEIADQQDPATAYDAMIDLACDVLIREARQAWRPPIVKASVEKIAASGAPVAAPSERVQALAHSNLAMMLPNGKRLGDARRGDVLEAATIFGRQGRLLVHQEKWLNAIADGMKPDRAVRDSFSEEQLAAMRRKIGD